MTIRGSCLCGKVQYELRRDPRFMYYCHCQTCQKATGSAFATNLIMPTEHFVIVAGQERITAYESSPDKHRYFCSVCGSPIYSHAQKTQHFVSVRCGTLDQDPGVRPAIHGFVASKAAWDEIHDGLPQSAGDFAANSDRKEKP